jgi:hypothetical protein
MVPILKVAEVKKAMLEVLNGGLKPGVRNNASTPPPDKYRRGGRRN